MERVTVEDAGQNFVALIERVKTEGVSVELVQDGIVVAKITPAASKKIMTMAEFGEFLVSLPSLGDDAEAFERDLNEIRESTRPKNPSP